MENESNNLAVATPKDGATMKDLLQEKGNLFVFPKAGDTVAARVIEKGRNRVFVDIKAFRTGVIYKGEMETSNLNIQDIKPGDILMVKIIDLENKEGLVEVSLNEVGLDQAWDEVRALKASGQTAEVKITGANRGGLTAVLNGLAAFLPASQLASGNYPHVEGGDKEEILKSLKKLVGQSVIVKIIDCDQKISKIILSEKAQVSKETKTKLTGYVLGDVISGEISGLVDFGAFVMFNGIEGLIHISEIGWQLVEKPSDFLKIGDQIQAKIIDIEGDKVSLSLKALKPNPWDEVEKKYKKGDVVMGTIAKFNPFGAFVKIDSEIQGLAHVSEFKTYQDMVAAVELNKTYQFKITLLEPKDYKMALQPVVDLETVTQTETIPSDPTDPADSLADSLAS